MARNDRQKAEVGETILQAARQTVVQGGFATLSIRKLAKAVEYTPGTIYVYFENRDAIMRELCVRAFAELAEQMEGAAGATDPRERLSALLHAYAGFALQHPDTYRPSFMVNPAFADAVMRAAPLEAENGAGRHSGCSSRRYGS